MDRKVTPLATAGEIAAAAGNVFHKLERREMPINCAHVMAKLLDVRLRALETERLMMARAMARAMGRD